MSDKHISSQFDTELNSISSHVLEMGGLVEAQLHQALYALVHLSLETAEQVLEKEAVINQMEMSIDHEIISTIGRRQPTARDLRFLMAISRTTQNLERAGDEIARIARMVEDAQGHKAPIQRLDRIACRLIDQPLAIPALRHLQFHLAARLLGKSLSQKFAIRQDAVQQDGPCRRHIFIKLREEAGEHLILGHLSHM